MRYIIIYADIKVTLTTRGVGARDLDGDGDDDLTAVTAVVPR